MSWLFYLAWPFAAPYFKFTFRFWKVPGKEKIPKGGKIYAVNHCGNAEGVILNLFHAKPVRFLGKSELFRMPHQRIAMKGVGTIPIKRGANDTEAFQHAVAALKKGAYVGIFPEGTRGNGIELLSPHTGVIRLALMTDVPIIPVGMSGVKNSWPKGKYLPRLRKKIWVEIGDPWFVPKPPKGQKYSYEELKALAEELMFERIEPLIDFSKNR